MSAAASLYQNVVIDHNRSPRNFRPLDPHSHHAVGYNPLCGDRVDLYLDLRDGVIRDAGFQGEACAIATASASLLTDLLIGRSSEEAEEIARHFDAALMGESNLDDHPELSELSALLAVRQYPGREKCARLAWRTLEAALSGETVLSVTTENAP